MDIQQVAYHYTTPTVPIVPYPVVYPSVGYAPTAPIAFGPVRPPIASGAVVHPMQAAPAVHTVPARCEPQTTKASTTAGKPMTPSLKQSTEPKGKESNDGNVVNINDSDILYFEKWKKSLPEINVSLEEYYSDVGNTLIMVNNPNFLTLY